MFVDLELDAYRLIKNRRKVVSALISITEETKTRGNRVLWDLWKKTVTGNLKESMENGTQVEFGKFVDGVNAMILGGFITEDEMASRLERALQQE